MDKGENWLCPIIRAECCPKRCRLGMKTKDGWMCVLRYVAERLTANRDNTCDMGSKYDEEV